MMHDPLSPHRHDPNPDPPSPNPDFVLALPAGGERVVRPADLLALPPTTVSDCFIVSTGHGTSGPFSFTGVLLANFLAAYVSPAIVWQQVEVISADGFGTLVGAAELALPGRVGQILLAYALDGVAMTRAQGLTRLIVPSETDEALRQIKWVGRLRVLAAP